MVAVPEIKQIDMAFGNISWLPTWNKIPDEYKRGHTPENKLVSQWFFNGLSESDIASLAPREGVDKNKALAACSACLRSFEPKHEHKEAGVAYLLNQWFSVGAKETKEQPQTTANIG